MTPPFFALPGSRCGLRAAPLKQHCAFTCLRRERDRLLTGSSRPGRTRIVAAWRVNGETGRLECAWTPDAEPDTGGGWRRMTERVALLLAICPQGRLAA